MRHSRVSHHHDMYIGHACFTNELYDHHPIDKLLPVQALVAWAKSLATKLSRSQPGTHRHSSLPVLPYDVAVGRLRQITSLWLQYVVSILWIPEVDKAAAFQWQGNAPYSSLFPIQDSRRSKNNSLSDVSFRSAQPHNASQPEFWTNSAMALLGSSS